MKFLISSLVVLGLTLSACSKDDKNNNKGFRDFNPTLKPQGAASETDVRGLLLKIKDASKYLPGEETYYDSTIEGTEAKNVDYSARNEAMQKLNNEGTRFVDAIKRNCTIKNATKKETGSSSVPTTGTTITTDLSMEC